jgi:hexosaminidase
MRLVCLFAILILLTSCQRQPEPTLTLPTLLPQPVYLERSAGIFSLPSSFLVDAPSGPELQPVLKSMSQWALIEGSADPSEAQLVFQERPNLPKEGYQLEVTSDQIVISYSDGAGAFYASQTLRQLLMQAKDNGQLPGMLIRDEPRFPHRGMHLDVGRHFFPPDFIKKYIDLLAMHKMNRFHWHLTEDQGWRIEIKRYPKLQSVAAFRDETLIGHYSDQPHQFDGKRYGGFYTQEEIREIVEYAQERFVTIIPEIDMPGHTQALLAAYPELSCHGKPVKVATKWGVFENVLCPTDTTFRFLEGVLTEVMDLFPGPYIHIGGDECPKTQWENSSFCQELMQREGLADENELQSYFNRRIDAFLTEHGKKLIGWDEILEGGLSPNATVMSWRGTKGGREAAEAGHDVIMSPTSHCYFDYYQSNHPDEPLAIGGFLPLKKVYQYEPIPEGLPVEAHKHILGAQGNVWTEYMKESKQVEYMAFPRAIALAEVVWSPAEVRDYEDFLDRLTHHLPLLDALEVNYAQHWLDINYHLERDSATDQLLLFLENRRQDPMQVTIGRDTPSSVLPIPFI